MRRWWLRRTFLASRRCAWGCVAAVLLVPSTIAPPDRLAVIRRAQVWRQTVVAAFDFKAGHEGIAPWSTVACDYVNKPLGGNTPKFACRLPGGETVKVKYGADNGEVYAGVAASRLLRALGFGADVMQPVRVDCRGCPARPGGRRIATNTFRFDVAAIEQKTKGHDVPGITDRGWRWSELDLVDPQAGGAARGQRDALELLAVFLQHTDNKPEQQRLVCPGRSTAASSCEQPLLMIHDVGQTFGAANLLNRSAVGSVNLAMWSATPIWKDETQCVGNLARSLTGNLYDPRISEEGRKFLADLLVQLSDAQLHDLFDVAHFADGPARMRPPEGKNTIGAWVDVFKRKRADIVRARCP